MISLNDSARVSNERIYTMLYGIFLKIYIWERHFGEKEFTEQKRVFKSSSDVHSGYGFVRMLGRIADYSI